MRTIEDSLKEGYSIAKGLKVIQVMALSSIPIFIGIYFFSPHATQKEMIDNVLGFSGIWCAMYILRRMVVSKIKKMEKKKNESE